MAETTKEKTRTERIKNELLQMDLDPAQADARTSTIISRENDSNYKIYKGEKVPMILVNSSHLLSVGYGTRHKVLYIKYHNGSVYEYYTKDGFFFYYHCIYNYNKSKGNMLWKKIRRLLVTYNRIE